MRLTERELDIMHVFWDHDEMTIGDVHESLRDEGADFAYTTIATMVKILHEKGFLELTKSKRPFRYRPSRSFQDVSKGLVDDLVERVFRGSRDALLVRLFEREKLTRQEQATLRELLQRKKP